MIGYNGDISFNVRQLYDQYNLVHIKCMPGGIEITKKNENGKLHKIDISHKDALRMAKILVAQYESWEKDK